MKAIRNFLAGRRVRIPEAWPLWALLWGSLVMFGLMAFGEKFLAITLFFLMASATIGGVFVVFLGEIFPKRDK